MPFPINEETSDKFPANDGAVTQSGELSVNTSEKMPEKMSEKTSEKTSEKILYLISENPRITTRELVDIIGIHERNVARNIKTLQERGFLRRIGGRKEGYWQVVTQ